MEPGYQLIVEGPVGFGTKNLAIVKDAELMFGEFPYCADFCIGLDEEQLMHLNDTLWPDDESNDVPLTRKRLHAALGLALSMVPEYYPVFMRIPESSERSQPALVEGGSNHA